MNSIQREMSAADVVSEIRLHRNSEVRGADRSFLLVEGHRDSLLLQKFVAEEDCLILICFGRDNVAGAIAMLDEEGEVGVVGIIDRDYVDFFPEEEVSSNIVYTDENDLEMMILCSPVLEQFLIQYGNAERVAQVRKETRQDARQVIFQSAACIGALRVLSRREQWNFKFSDLSFCYDSNTSINVDMEGQCGNILMQALEVDKPTIQDLVEKARRLRMEVDDVKLLCRGRDCIRILRRAIRYLFKGTNEFDSDKRQKGLEKVLRLAYDHRYFERTNMYTAVRDWEGRSGLRVLR